MADADDVSGAPRMSHSWHIRDNSVTNDDDEEEEEEEEEDEEDVGLNLFSDVAGLTSS